MPSRTGMYLNGRIWSLSTPLDLLRFRRCRCTTGCGSGSRRCACGASSDWHAIEHLSIREWLAPLCGERAYERGVGAARPREVRPLRRRRERRVDVEEARAAGQHAQLVGRRGARLLQGRVRPPGRGDREPTSRRTAARSASARASRASRPTAAGSPGLLTSDGAGRGATSSCSRRRWRSSPTSSTARPPPTGCESLRRVELPRQHLPRPAPLAQPVGHVLAERQRSRVPVRRRHRAHELRRARALRRRPDRLPVPLPRPGRPGCGSWTTRSTSTTRSSTSRRMFPRLRPRPGCATTRRGGRATPSRSPPAATRTYVPPRETPFAERDDRDDGPDLSGGPRHELRDPRRHRGGRATTGSRVTTLYERLPVLAASRSASLVIAIVSGVVGLMAVGARTFATFTGGGADMAHHYALVFWFSNHWTLPAPDAGLSTMASYPPVAHVVAGLLGRVVDSPFRGMQLVAIAAVVMIWCAIAALLTTLPGRRRWIAFAALAAFLALDTSAGPLQAPSARVRDHRELLLRPGRRAGGGLVARVVRCTQPARRSFPDLDGEPDRDRGGALDLDPRLARRRVARPRRLPQCS